jgi:hypothetical protein
VCQISVSMTCGAQRTFSLIKLDFATNIQRTLIRQTIATIFIFNSTFSKRQLDCAKTMALIILCKIFHLDFLHLSFILPRRPPSFLVLETLLRAKKHNLTLETMRPLRDIFVPHSQNGVSHVSTTVEHCCESFIGCRFPSLSVDSVLNEFCVGGV